MAFLSTIEAAYNFEQIQAIFWEEPTYNKSR
jgi:hypothetical protein